jgi:hypothetical protein
MIGWRKRNWRCPATECEIRTWTEQSDAIGARRALTERARREACRRVGRNHSVAEGARELGVGWPTVMAAVADYGTPLLEDPDRIAAVQQLGLGRGEVPEGRPEAADPLRHRVRGPRPGPAARRRPRPDRSGRPRLAHRPSGRLAPDGHDRGDRSEPGLRQRRRDASRARHARGRRVPRREASQRRHRQRFVAGSSRKPSGTEATRTTRSTGSAGCSSRPERH